MIFRGRKNPLGSWASTALKAMPLPRLRKTLRVGFRPLNRYEIEYWREDADYLDKDLIKTRLSVKPEITGLWQICDKTRISFKEWVKIYLEYVEKWSFILEAQNCDLFWKH